jgi:hypothetical protein
MNRTIEVEFTEEAAVEIPAVTSPNREIKAIAAGPRQFWIGWQLFRPE